MGSLKTLLDSNVIVAGVAEEHSHHAASVKILMAADPRTVAVTGHSYAETFTTLTRRNGPAPYGWEPAEAWQAIESVGVVTTLIGLSPAQTVDAVRRFADDGGIGARVYDWLIGEAAVQSGVERIVTWNDSHFRGLFPKLEILTPDQALA